MELEIILEEKICLFHYTVKELRGNCKEVRGNCKEDRIITLLILTIVICDTCTKIK